MVKKKNLQELPFVSICTPTFNRRPFIPAMIECFNHQTYPKDKMEWIIIDDGTDKIEDLVKDIPNVQYFKYDIKMPLGKKRNLMHTKTKGEIIIYMDDDDYYPPERVSHAVTMLLSHPKALCAGSSEIYIYFKHIQKMYQFGPYGPNHATAGTFAFKRKLLQDHRYDDNASLAEERAFLKDYSVPFVQLEPKKTILVFSHTHNTFDKKTLLNNINQKYTKESDKKVEDFIKEKKLVNFFVNEIEDALINYKYGEPSMKPDVLEQIKTITAKREMMINENIQAQAQAQSQGQLCHVINGKQEVLKPEEIVVLLTQQDSTIKMLQETLKKKESYIKLLESKLSKTDEWTIIQDE